jgi:hypothetical protein
MRVFCELRLEGGSRKFAIDDPVPRGGKVG